MLKGDLLDKNLNGGVVNKNDNERYQSRTLKMCNFDHRNALQTVNLFFLIPLVSNKYKAKFIAFTGIL